MCSSDQIQLRFPAPSTWGGRRKGAGRKCTPGRRSGVPHRTRPRHNAAHPVHVTLRTTSAVGCLRAASVFPGVRRALAAASREGFRIIEFSAQDNHLHLLVEAEDLARLSRGIGGLAIRAARAVNRALGRQGAVWADRFHARAITTPRAMRHALVYVLANRQKHCEGERGLDPCSSARWFDGWRDGLMRPPTERPPVARAHTWLAAVGWRRHGLIGADERPRHRRSLRGRPRTDVRGVAARQVFRHRHGLPWPRRLR